ncbi:MAG: TRAP transporter large permease [Gammaproteobacteria bacterium]|nr:MAG: TRAP transporter large permease [Gammaproteobacteria bacterium]
MDPLVLGPLAALTLIVLLLTGMPVAFALGVTALIFLAIQDGIGAFTVVAETLFASLDEFALLSIPMFLVMGSAIAASRAGADLYEAIDRWLYKVPGGLLVSNIGACGVFAALTGSSPATCAAIGKMGIPEMRSRGYPAGLATGSIAAGGTLGILIPPSITMIVYGIATETSIGRLFAAGLMPGIMLVMLFIAWSLIYAYIKGYRFTEDDKHFSLKDKLVILPKVIPFLAVIVMVLWALYGGVATPSEASGVGALFCILLVMIIYRLWRPKNIWEIFSTATRESVMLMMIIGMAGLFSYMMSSLYITQGIAEYIAEQDLSPLLLMLYINVFLLVAGFFLPPVAVILMTSPTLVPIIIQAGFDPIWFGVLLTLNMEIGLITPPVGLNLYVINGIVPDVDLKTVLIGALPFMLCMVVGIGLLIMFPQIALWLPDVLMGPAF